jgi:tetraether lipid synthase
VYLQFDSFERQALMEIRGADLRAVRRKALDRCNELGISTTLEATLKRGTNDQEIGRLIEFALEQPCVRGVSLQPVQVAGRTEGFDPLRDRLTLTEVRRKVLEQTSVFRPEDVLPVPCHPDSIAMAFALKHDGRVTPLTGLIPPEVLIEGGRNTVLYQLDERIPEALFAALSTGHSPDGRAATLKRLLCCLPAVPVPETIGYRNVFRLIILQLMDAHAFDVRSVKKSCIHIVHPDGRLIPVDTYNLFYRDDLESTRLAALRAGGGATRRLPVAPP